MKIRSYFTIVILALTAVPLLFLSGFAVYLYIMSPERAIMKNLEKVQGYNQEPLSKSDKTTIARFLRERPPNLSEAFFFSDGQTISSTIPSIPNEGFLDLNKLTLSMMGGNEKYFYQISSLPFGDSDKKLMHIVRFPKDVAAKGALKNGTLPRPRDFVALFAVIFEAIFAALSIFMLSRIAQSVNLVESEAKKLDSGDIENAISIPLDKGHSNEITSLLVHLESFRKTFLQRKKQRDSFVMGLSHDLKTPLAVIKGYTEGIADGLFEAPKKKAECLELILQKTAQLEMMVDDLVSYVKMNETDWTKDLADADLRLFLEGFSKYIKPTCEIFKRDFECSIDIPPGVSVKLDEQMASRALGNIFANSVRYSNPGTSVSLDAKIVQGQAQITISDQGVGMSEEDAKRAFELFYRGTKSRREQGHGIGLSVVKTVADIHGWDIKIESELQKGSRFIITIPIAVKPGLIS